MTDAISNFRATNRQSFINFIDLLRKDLIENPENWENQKLEDFLEAIGAYAKDIQGYIVT